MKRYEYKFVRSKAKLGLDYDKKCAQAESEWNELGQQGWKFLAFGDGAAIFMKEIDE